MNINRYALCKERSLQKIISKQPKPNTTAIGVCSETQVTHHIITKRSDECLPISAYVPKHKEGDGKKFPVIIDIYGGDFVAGRSALNRNFGTWCAEHGYLTFIPEYTPVPETNLFGQLGDLLKAFVVIHRCAERYGADMSRMYLVGDGAGAALACLVYALLWNPVSMQHLEDELPFDVPQEAKLTFKAVCLQNGILDLSSRKMNAIAPYLIEKDWKKTSYAECLSPKTYAKMLPPCFLVMSITDAHKRDTNQLAWQLKLKGTRYLFEGGFWTGHGIGCFDKTALCYDIGSVHSLASAIMRICATYENLTNFRKVFVERLVISKERMNEIKQYTDGGKKQDEIEFESVTFADGMCMDVRCVPRKDGPSWCEAAIYYADEDVVASEPYNSFYNHWVCQTANATYHLYMGVADTE